MKPFDIELILYSIELDLVKSNVTYYRWAGAFKYFQCSIEIPTNVFEEVKTTSRGGFNGKRRSLSTLMLIVMRPFPTVGQQV